MKTMRIRGRGGEEGAVEVARASVSLISGGRKRSREEPTMAEKGAG